MNSVSKKGTSISIIPIKQWTTRGMNKENEVRKSKVLTSVSKKGTEV